MKSIVVSGYCETGGLAAALSAMLPDSAVIPFPDSQAETADGEARFRAQLFRSEAWITTVPAKRRNAILGSTAPPSLQVVPLPTINFRAFHPDVGSIRKGSATGPLLEGPFGRHYNSLIVFWSYLRGLSVAATERLFTPETFSALGYLDVWDVELQRLKETVGSYGIDFPSFFLPLQRSGAFMHTINHPKISVLIQLARHAGQQLGAPRELIQAPLERIVPDGLASMTVLPLYPGIAETFGLKGAYLWNFGSGRYVHGLRQYITQSFEEYRRQDTEVWDSPRLQNPVYDRVLSKACGKA